ASASTGLVVRMSCPSTRRSPGVRPTTSAHWAPNSRAPSASHCTSGPVAMPRMSLALKMVCVNMVGPAYGSGSGTGLGPVHVGVGEQPQVPTATHLDHVVGHLPTVGVLVGQPDLAYGVGERQQVVAGGFRGGLVRFAEPDHLPTPRGRQRGGVLAAQVVAVRLGAGGEWT